MPKVEEGPSSISTSRLYQAAWFVVSVYFAVLITDVTKDGLVPAVLGAELDLMRLWIIAPTLILYFLSAQEAYLWLTPKEDEEVSISKAVYLGAHLIIYPLAVIVQAFLARACTDKTLGSIDALSHWAAAFAGVTGAYCLYNIFSLVVTKLKGTVEFATAPPRFRNVLFYLFSSALFLVESRWGARLPGAWYGMAIFVSFIAYFVGYLKLWRSWFLSTLAPPPG